MSAGQRQSNCSLGIPIKFYWHSCADPDGHLECAVEAVWKAIDGPTRRWSPHNRIIARAEIRRRLDLAEQGGLVPVDHVKPVGNGDAALFEIRWSGITVAEVDSAGDVRYVKVQARLYHAEPVEIATAAVGLHAHEKRIYPGDSKRTRREQDAEIAIAERAFAAGWPDRWGLPL